MVTTIFPPGAVREPAASFRVAASSGQPVHSFREITESAARTPSLSPKRTRPRSARQGRMADAPLRILLQHLHRRRAAPAANGADDAELLGRFVRDRDEAA